MPTDANSMVTNASSIDGSIFCKAEQSSQDAFWRTSGNLRYMHVWTKNDYQSMCVHVCVQAHVHVHAHVRVV